MKGLVYKISNYNIGFRILRLFYYIHYYTYDMSPFILIVELNTFDWKNKSKVDKVVNLSENSPILRRDVEKKKIMKYNL